MSASPKKYDVFISFWGEDTRRTFTGELHDALCKENIESYIDYNLKQGDEVGPALAQAIQDSHISLVVFSENYASSKWCLDELLKILECRKHQGQVVIPVFYEIDPSHVRHQRGSYEKAFAKYERELRNNESYEDKVSGWRAALTQAANISGWDSRGWDSRSYENNTQVIKNIVNDVWQKLSLMYPNELKDVVQMDENSEYIESLLKKFPRIGIWGMGGIGKTTIARQMFAKYFAQYDSACFLEKVREESEKFGLAYVRNKLLTELLKRQITMSDVLGPTFIKRRLSGRKVFIVLDDVDNSAQLEDLCEELDDLGPNSRLIITTRNKHLLNGIVDKIYAVIEWKPKESLKLFCLGAFKQSNPKEGFEHLSERAVAHAGGIPLALKVLGSHFHSRNPKFWQAELNYLENKGESLGKIQEVLKVSYNGLMQEKEMFLDIAFFFKGENKDFVTRILDACGFNATSGIEILEDKALITVSNSKRIQMHDLVQKMALDIIRMGPRKHSRLRDTEEVRDILRNNKGADAVEGIIFDLSQKVNLHVRADTFNKMTDLRFLKLYVPLGKKRSATMHHPEVIMSFSDKLRYLEWNGYPLKSLPQPFCAELLVEIRLPYSDVEYLWHGMQELVNLEAIDLSECKQLIKLPDLSGASKLKWLYLSGCESLCEVLPCIFSKDTLVTLLLDRCKNLQSLTSEKHLTALEKINVYGCLNLKEFSLSSDSIESLDLSNTGIEILHSSIGHQSKLAWLSLEGLRLMNLPNELSRLRSLTELRLSNCNIVTKSKLQALFDGLISVKILYLKDCCNLFELPTNISSLQSLYELRLDGISVERLPASIKYLSELEIMSLNNCKKLSCLPELSPNIKEFNADNCTSLVTVSTLKTFSERMNGKDKYISFKNDVKLEGPSLDRITEDAILTMKSAAFHNVLVRKYSAQTHSYNYNNAEVCLPGGKVPKQFKFRTTDSSITIGLPHLSYSLGFIFSVVVSPSHGIKEHGTGAKIQCQCYLEDGRKVGYASTWHHKAVSDLELDHVFVWYDPYHFDSILGNDETKVSFEFCVTNGVGERDGFFSLRECGVCPIYFSELPRFLGTMNLDRDVELMLLLEFSLEAGPNLNEAMQFESESIESCDEKEGGDIESIERCDDQKESTMMRSNLFSSGIELAAFATICQPLSQSWGVISSRYAGIISNAGVGLSWKVYKELGSDLMIIAFEATPDSSNFQADLVSSSDLREKNFLHFEFLCTKRNPLFSLNSTAVSLFCENHRKLDQLKYEVISSIPIALLIITGHALGGSVASLFTISLLDYIGPGKNRPICITFGSPLVGDEKLQAAISRSSNWNSCFLHVVSHKDPLPTLLITNPTTYMPFGTFLLCSDTNSTCFENPDSILEILVALGSIHVQKQGYQSVDYGTMVENLKLRAICKDFSTQAEDMTHPDSLASCISLQLRVLGLRQHMQQQQQNIDINILETIIKQLEQNLIRQRMMIFDPSKRLYQMEGDMAGLEWYKKHTKHQQTGYYDSYKNLHSSVDHDVLVSYKKLTRYWEKMVEEAEMKPQKEGAAFRNTWLYAGTNYRRMVEPLAIAEYYREGGKDYVTEKRPKHFEQLEEWLMRGTRKAKNVLNSTNRKNVESILTMDSCFWAHVEEALLSCEELKVVKEKEEALKKLLEFEVYVYELLKNYAVSPEIFLAQSSYMRWWNEYREIRGTSHTSALANFMNDARKRELYALGAYDFYDSQRITIGVLT